MACPEMEIIRITPDFSVSAQISLQDIVEVARLGFRTIIVNRPDVESSDQTSFGARSCGKVAPYA